MKKHFVTFYSPGTFMPEDTCKEIESWDVEEAKRIATTITERHGATPYGFRFTTMESTDWEPQQLARSPMYYLPHCKVETRDEIEARNLPNEGILRSNMRNNGIDRVVTTTTGWKTTLPLHADDVVLEASNP